jgi:hypothetical protein
VSAFCKFYAKGRWVFLGLLLVVAVTTVLITPDPTDDIHAVLRQEADPPISAPASAAELTPLSKISVNPPFIHRLNLSSAQHPMAPNLLRMICIWRC